MITTYEDAISQIAEFGLRVDAPVVDGRIKRVCWGDEPMAKKSGFYKLKEIYRDGLHLIDGFYGSFKINERAFQLKRRVDFEIDRPELEKIKRKYQDKVMAELEQERERQAYAADRAAFIWDEGTDEGESPYLDRKLIKPFGARFHGSSVLVPITKEGRLTSLQAIGKSGKKKYLFGGDIKGGHFVIKGSSKVAMVEGFATGATVHMATGWSVVVCFSAGGLVNVAPYLKDHDVIVCADNDEATEQKTGGNPGIRKARDAAKYLGCKMVYVRNEGDLSITDFNDVHVKRGLDCVRSQLEF
jgi:putative DNA primase/helicase